MKFLSDVKFAETERLTRRLRDNENAKRSIRFIPSRQKLSSAIKSIFLLAWLVDALHLVILLKRTLQLLEHCLSEYNKYLNEINYETYRSV